MLAEFDAIGRDAHWRYVSGLAYTATRGIVQGAIYNIVAEIASSATIWYGICCTIIHFPNWEAFNELQQSLMLN
jgi:hypothetical protein